MMLKAEHISVRRGRKEIVRDVSFEVHENEWLMICGPNGAGKSTLLSAVSRELPCTGTVTLNGRDVLRMSARELASQMAVLRQLSDFSYAYSVEEVVAMGRYAHRGFLHTDEGGSAAIESALATVHMADKRRQSILTLSGGERQRVLLAQVLCQQPQVLLLDEPGNHLDLGFQQELYELIDRWRQEAHHLVVSVVHDLSAARKFGTHALLMADGCGIFGNCADILTAEHLQSAWGMDVIGWMRSLQEAWLT
jgi:iron complex transport system ATP-binding protein